MKSEESKNSQEFMTIKKRKDKKSSCQSCLKMECGCPQKYQINLLFKKEAELSFVQLV